MSAESPTIDLVRQERRPLHTPIGIFPSRNERRSRVHRLGRLAATIALLLATAPAVTQAKTLPTDLVDGTPASERGVSLQSLPDVTVAEGAVVDSTGRLLWGRSPSARRPMASITKIMTAVVALEHSSLAATVTVPREAAVVGQSSAGLYANQKISMGELLEALLVKSGNDAAVAIAVDVGGSQKGFVDMMNAKAKDLGLTDTHYTNPHGLDAPGHYTTARDLAVLARYAMAKPAFADIVRRRSVTIGHGKWRRTLYSTDLLLGIYDGAMGVKTGNTSGAGYSVVSAAQRQGVMLYAIVMGTKSDRARFLDAKAMLDWGFAHYRPMRIANKGSVVAEAPVGDYLDTTVGAVVSKDATISVLDLNGPIQRTVQIGTAWAPVNAGDPVGTITYTQGSHVVATVPLVATAKVGKPNPFESLWIGVVRVWKRIFG